MPKITRSMKEDPPRKNHHLLIRLPMPLSERVVHQAQRLSCSLNMFARLAFVRLVEEEEAKERGNAVSYPQ